MGCAGGKDTQAVFHYQAEAANPSLLYFVIDIKGLNGGHSGGEIHKGLGNANKILARFLLILTNAEIDYTLCSMDGGNLRNAIAREAHAVIGIHSEDKETVRVMLNNYTADVENELKRVDPKVQISMESTARPETQVDKATADKLILALNACPHGVIGMSHDMPGLVETSTNLASVKMKPNHTIRIETSQRSSILSARNDMAETVRATFALAGANISHGDGYPGWKPNPNSEILEVAAQSYQNLFNKEAKVKAIHAGLECGLFLDKYPHLDMISFGPTMTGVHSPDERLHSPSVKVFWGHLLDILANIPEKK